LPWAIDAQLQREAFGEIARQHAGRIEALQHDKRGFAIFPRGSKALRQFIEIGAHVTGFIDRFDQHLGNEALMGLQRRDAELGFQMTFQRRFRREVAFEIFIPVGAASRSCPRPIGQRQIGRRPRLALSARFSGFVWRQSLYHHRFKIMLDSIRNLQ